MCDNAAIKRYAARVFFSGVYSWLVKVLGQFSIIYFRGLGLGLGFGLGFGLGLGLVWCYGQGKFRVRVRIRVWVNNTRVVNMFGVMVMVRVNTTRNINPDP